MKANNFSISEFYCTKCGNKGIPIPRPVSCARGKGHLKKIYCVHCQKEVNHVEIRSFDTDYTYEDFIKDFHDGKFNDEEEI